MINPALPARLHLRRWFALGSVLALLLGAAAVANAQGLVKGVQDGAAAGNKAAGPVGGVLGGAIGGVVGVFTGVLGVGNNGNQAPAAKDANKDASKDAKQQGAAKDAKSAKAGKGAKATKEARNAPQDAKDKDVTVLTQTGAPQLTADQIVSNSDSYIERIKTELNLTPDQEKHWYGFSSAMHYLGHNGAERLNLRVARAKRDPPDDIIEQMRNEAQFLIDRAADQRNVADAAEPLYSSLDDKQKQVFIQEMVRLSHERGLD
ncbi:Spy/CpxP family protein refolding chaperone [Bradyrhizobium sp. CB2312]|uniref:Spy/CpxP family protein refolding chaperone n=1 Tax=Bradyrhizobium sp. CB2312 TaxID=3039155 RepID=UPI0024B113BC|nr:Spy/CpxP family protein refolding chaperone [Bradyrhizobium sp. CB2312]WFU68562.1 Spy/CpxP family protein refolding chaperone [Bradyrhizobium sp. CB2312]